MTIYAVLVPLWIFWNLFPFLLLGWLWKDQVKHRKPVAIIASASLVYFLWGYFVFQNSVIATPLIPVVVVFIFSGFLAVHNHFYVKAHNKRL
ncbi:hypothetical protein [Simiduia litorea]|uniref:hypothetical protein n=1 Tax=Simiduia litorea TaxID=1435348 RepID=UPI0036F3D704